MPADLSADRLTALEPDAIEAFLHYGFVPRVPEDLGLRPWARGLGGSALPRDERACLRAGLDALESLFAEIPPGLQVVPLSGGLDSRVILGLLAERVARERLLAVTFGTPGTLDYELAGEVARCAGVRHERIDLTREAFDVAGLGAVLPPGGPWSHAFEAYFNALVPRRFGQGACLWSGIMANVLNGSRVGDPREDWGTACRTYARESRGIRSVRLTRASFDPAAVLPRAPLLPASALTYAEQLHVAFHYPCRFDAVLLTPGFVYRTPFREPRWVDFALALPREFRRGERLFRAVIRHRLPRLLALPTKSHHGVALSAPAWRAGLAHQRQSVARRLRRFTPWLAWGPAPGVNYLDFERELRHPTPTRAVVRACLDRLARRGIVDWIELERLWERHTRGRANLGDALVQLAVLELNLAAGDG